MRGRFFQVFVFLFLFPVNGWAVDKIQLEMLQPGGAFEMDAGEPLEIKFKAMSNRGDLYYAIFLRQADQSPLPQGEGPLTLSANKLKMGLNSFRWDGESFAWAPTDKPVMGKLKQSEKVSRYYLQIRIFNTKDLKLVGRLADYHKKEIATLRSRAFKIK